jgi:hypothetical protein
MLQHAAREWKPSKDIFKFNVSGNVFRAENAEVDPHRVEAIEHLDTRCGAVLWSVLGDEIVDPSTSR